MIELKVAQVGSLIVVLVVDTENCTYRLGHAPEMTPRRHDTTQLGWDGLKLVCDIPITMTAKVST